MLEVIILLPGLGEQPAPAEPGTVPGGSPGPGRHGAELRVRPRQPDPAQLRAWGGGGSLTPQLLHHPPAGRWSLRGEQRAQTPPGGWDGDAARRGGHKHVPSRSKQPDGRNKVSDVAVTAELKTPRRVLLSVCRPPRAGLGQPG